MITRYSIKEIDDYCSDLEKLKRWAQVELAIINGLQKYKFINKEEYKTLISKFKWDLDLTNILEKETKHDVFAFIKCLNKLTNTPLKKWIHYGITSTDIVDTANGLLYKEINKIILKDLDHLILVVKKLALKYKKTLMLAKTHGQGAEPTTLGFKLINWFDQLQRNKKNFEISKKLVEVGKISGAVGTYAHLPKKEFEKYVCKLLKLNCANISTQILSRDRHAQYFNSLILIVSSISSFANEIRLLSIEGINEISEGFDINQKGSSAMPQKKNPISCENICGLSRIIKSYASTVYENITTWNERDISHSSTERILNQDFISLTIYIIRRFINVLENLAIDKNNMLNNLKKSSPKIYSQTIMLYLIQNYELDRLDAYEIIKASVAKANSLEELIKIINKNLSSKNQLTFNELKTYLIPTYHIRHVNSIINDVIKTWEKKNDKN